MTLDVAGVFADAWRMWKRDRDLLLGVAGLFLFVPQLAMEVLVPPAVIPPGSTTEAAFKTWWAWLDQNSGIMSFAMLGLMFGTLLLFTLYLDPQRPSVRDALMRALSLAPRYLLAVMLISIPVDLGVILILPGVYILGRLMLTVPALVAERPLPALRAIARSFAITSGHGLVLAGFACISLFSGTILAWPFHAIGEALGGAPMANPVAAFLLGVGAAGGLAAAMVASILLEVSLYRRLGASKGI